MSNFDLLYESLIQEKLIEERLEITSNDLKRYLKNAGKAVAVGVTAALIYFATKTDENTSYDEAISGAMQEAMKQIEKTGEKASPEKVKAYVENILKHKAQQQQKEAGKVKSWFLGDNKSE